MQLPDISGTSCTAVGWLKVLIFLGSSHLYVELNTRKILDAGHMLSQGV